MMNAHFSFNPRPLAKGYCYRFSECYVFMYVRVYERMYMEWFFVGPTPVLYVHMATFCRPLAVFD